MPLKKNKLKVVIPSRYGSSRLPAKPLLKINDKPMFWHVAQRVLEAGIPLEDIIIATDSKKIFDKAKSLSLPTIMTSNEHVSGTDRVNEVALKMSWPNSTLVMNVQGDEPLIPDSLIRELLNFTLINNHFDITTASTKFIDKNEFNNPNVVKIVTTENNKALYFTRSPVPFNRGAPDDFVVARRHIGIYVYKVSVLKGFCGLPESQLENCEKLEQLRALSNNLSIGVMGYTGAVPHGIDTVDDYQSIKFQMECL